MGKKFYIVIFCILSCSVLLLGIIPDNKKGGIIYGTVW